jgi:hypothetical protein
MPAGLPGFQSGWQAGSLGDAWSAELSSVAEAARGCAEKIRQTSQAYIRAETTNSGLLR